jgi:hypothetical protein
MVDQLLSHLNTNEILLKLDRLLVNEIIVSVSELTKLLVTGGYGGGSSGGSRGGSDELTVMEDTIFVSGMTESSSELEIQGHFGSIGVIKVCLFMSVVWCTSLPIY